MQESCNPESPNKVLAHSCALCNSSTELLTVDKYTFEETYTKLVQLAERSKQLVEDNKWVSQGIPYPQT